MRKPLFSICVICRNEATTLPRLIKSVKEFTDRGGKVYVLDTGSTDKTVDVAKELGCVVREVGSKYLIPITNAKAINQRFLVKGEKQIVKDGDKFFNFSAARNECAKMAETDVVFWADADEVKTVMDIDKINRLIEQGYGQFEYSFTFAYDSFGNEAIKFTQSKAYNKTQMAWFGIVHELIQPINNSQPKRIYIDESIYKLSHHQNQESGRHTYLTGLAVDAFNNPKADRQSHYLARELMWSERYKSAIKEFKRHITLRGWWQETAQSAIYIGDCYGKLNEPSEQVAWYNKAFYMDSSRREALIKLAYFYKSNNNFLASICYAKAALEIQYNGFYANNMAHYTHEPHAVLYFCYGWLGNITQAQEHILKALEFNGYNPQYLHDTRYYFEYPANEIEGWMRFPELKWLYETAKKMKVIVEVGSWKGKSTHALLSGCKEGIVTAVDTWEGSIDPRDDTNRLAKMEDVFEVFNKNVGHFKNLRTIRKTSIEAAKDFEDGSIDMCFIDAGHTAEEVKADILAWLPKVKIGGIISGHDYDKNTWMTVCEGVDELLDIDGVCDSIWYKKVDGKVKKPLVKNELQIMRDKIIKGENFSFVKLGDGEMVCMLEDADNKVNCDGHKFSKELGDKLKSAYNYFSSNNVIIGDRLDNLYRPVSGTTWEDDKKAIFEKTPKCIDGNILLNDRLDDNLKSLFKTIKQSQRRKVLIAPERLKQVVGFLNVNEHIIIPATNAYDEYQVVREKILKSENDNAIFIFCAGFMTKVITHDILKINRSVTCLDFGSSFDPIFGFMSRQHQLPTEVLKSFYKELLPHEQKIPRRIFTAWLSYEPTPPMIEKIIETQKIDGYEHHVITVENCPKDIPYVNDAITAKKWVKAVDYLRMWYLDNYGGVYLDADMEILPNKNFDELLQYDMFAAREENNFVANSLVGSIPNHPLFKKYFDEVNSRFKGNDDLYFQSSMELFTPLAYEDPTVKILEPEYFFPYNHQTGVINVTDKSIAFHHFQKSWINTTDLLPTVSIIIPQLGRPKGLKRCLNSIDKLYYPKHLIETIIIEGDETVPEKIKKGVHDSKGQIICYAANDIEFEPTSLYNAIKMTDKYGLVSFNTGELLPDNGNICEHFVIKKELIEKIGEIFSTKMNHCGVDNLLWAKASKLNQAVRCEDAIIHHYHFSKGADFDEVYQKGWANVDNDRKTLNEELATFL